MAPSPDAPEPAPASARAAVQQPSGAGIALVLGCYTLWGVFPLYFRLLADAGSVEIIGHRIVWTLVTCLGLVTVRRRWGRLRRILRCRCLQRLYYRLPARLRLAIKREATTEEENQQERVVRAGNLVIDTQAYSAHLSGTALNLTFKEFELLKFMAQHPGRVFSRAQLLSEVWGYDSYYGGTRTVDVHVRRLRSKLGTEYEQMISTVRNVGYSFNSTR